MILFPICSWIRWSSRLHLMKQADCMSSLERKGLKSSLRGLQCLKLVVIIVGVKAPSSALSAGDQPESEMSEGDSWDGSVGGYKCCT